MAVIPGTTGNDVLEGTASADQINAGAGDDLIISSDGVDTIDGGDGSDMIDYTAYTHRLEVVLKDEDSTIVIANGAASDVLSSIENVIGGTAGDYIVGNKLDNILHGNDGDDEFLSSAGFDTYFGDAGTDTVDYSELTTGIRIVVSDAGYSTMTAYGTLFDRLWNIENIVGGTRGDVIKGDASNNLFLGISGKDRLFGGAGGDVLDGGAGQDRLTGGADADIFRFTGAFGHDRIQDFAAKGAVHDQIDLSAIDGLVDFATLMAENVHQHGANVEIHLGDSGTIFLRHVDSDDLTVDHFLF